jgi:hypothetical protein
LFGLVSYSYIERQAVPRDTDVRVTKPAGEKLLTTPISQIVALRFKDRRGCVAISQSDVWKVEGVPETGVDADAIAQLLSTIETARELRTFDSDPLELAQYGLAAPSLIIGIQRRGEGEFRNLLLGDKNPVGDAVYAKWAQAPQVFILGSYFETLVRMMVQRVREGQKEFSSDVCPD